MDSYSEILSRMKENFALKAGYVPSDTSDCGLRLQTYASEIFEAYLYAEWLKKQMFIQSADGESLDKHAAAYGLTRLSGTKARGNVWFSLTQTLETDVIIPAGTQLISKDGLNYYTDATVKISSGEQSVRADVTAEECGAGYNCGEDDIEQIGKNEIQVVGVAMRNIVTVTSAEVGGGTDTEQDEFLRQRLLNKIRYPSTGANIGYYRDLLSNVDGVRSVNFLLNEDHKSVVYAFLGGNGTVVSSQTVTQAQDVLNELGQVGVDIIAAAAVAEPVNISIGISVGAGYDFNRIQDECELVLQNYLSTRSVGEKITSDLVKNALCGIEGLDKVTVKNSTEFPVISHNQLITPGVITVSKALL